MRRQLTIGEFSAMTHLSIRTLRRYHSGGLLVPAEIDPWNGYRYYGPEQIAPALTIRRLRELDMPVREIADLIAVTDERRRHELLTGHLERLEQRMEQTRASVRALRRLLDPAGDPLDVQVREVEESVVASITAVVGRGALLDWYPEAMAELDAALAALGRQPVGAPGAVVDDAVFTADRGSVTVYLPVPEPPTTGRVVPMTVPAGTLAVTVHRGDHTDIDVTYGRLAGWLLAHGFTVEGMVRETYLVGPRDTADPSRWRTEIGWPVVAE